MWQARRRKKKKKKTPHTVSQITNAIFLSRNLKSNLVKLATQLCKNRANRKEALGAVKSRGAVCVFRTPVLPIALELFFEWTWLVSK